MELVIEYQKETYRFQLNKKGKTEVNIEYDWLNSWDYSFSIYQDKKMLLEFDHDDYVYIDNENEPKLLEHIDKKTGVIDILIDQYVLKLYTDIVDDKINKITYFEWDYFLT